MFLLGCLQPSKNIGIDLLVTIIIGYLFKLRMQKYIVTKTFLVGASFIAVLRTAMKDYTQPERSRKSITDSFHCH